MLRIGILLVAAALPGGSAQAQLDINKLPPDLAQKIDQVAQQALDQTGVPSASVGIVRDGVIAYTHAYGKARLDPPEAAEPAMRYSVGSISKQFTAAAILLLEQQGKLSIDDKVAKYLPDLTRANETPSACSSPTLRAIRITGPKTT
jgi:CubicO group peptidase (beta-lactamase class C family)